MSFCCFENVPNRDFKNQATYQTVIFVYRFTTFSQLFNVDDCILHVYAFIQNRFFMLLLIDQDIQYSFRRCLIV